MRRLNTGMTVILMLPFGLSLGCAARTPDTAETSVPAPRARTSIAATLRLDDRFARETSPAEKMRIATQLAQTSHDPRYLEYLEQQVDGALRRRAKQIVSIERQQITSSTVAAVRDTEADARSQGTNAALAMNGRATASLPNDRTIQVRGASRGRARAILTDQDDSALAAVIALSIAGGSDGTVLRRALDTGNYEIGCEAALGLAKLKKKDAIPSIAEVGRAADDPFPCAQALVYFGDPAADVLAAGLLKDEHLLQELHATARERHFDPYYRGK